MSKLLARPWAFAFVAVILACSMAIPVSANTIHTVEMQVDLHSDGSATITEVWDLTMSNASNTEWYVAKYNLDNMQLRDLSVQEILDDGTVVPFETLSRWDTSGTRSEKAGKCGLVATKGGYEVCWGFGELGPHKYIVGYTVTNIVKGYEGGDAMGFKFLTDAAGGADRLDITFQADEFDFVYPETRVWVFGYEANSSFEEGGVSVFSQGPFRQSDYAAIMLAFEPGLLSPTDLREQHVDDFIAEGMKGSAWKDEPKSGSSGSKSFGMLVMFAAVFFMPVVTIVVAFILKGMRGGGTQRSSRTSLPAMYRNVPYCRDLPFQGHLAATYTRLYYLNQIDDSAVIGCFLLQWVRSRQVEIIQTTTGVVRKREESALKLYAPRPGMDPLEQRLYDMVVEAAGKDSILQSREFEKWARGRYRTVETWLTDYRATGNGHLNRIGAYAMVPVTKFFGLIHTTERKITPHGEGLTMRMFGFLRYLKEFTIINEREAKEVQLWDQYLVFAQLFGIADQVAGQFRQLYPAFFTQQNSYNHYGYDVTDILIATEISTRFGRSMYTGYRAGVSAASSGSSSSGGGGSSSSSGGGSSFSGGGGAGGR